MLLQITATKNLRTVIPIRCRCSGAGVVLVAIGGKHQRVARMGVKRQGNETHGAHYRGALGRGQYRARFGVLAVSAYSVDMTTETRLNRSEEHTSELQSLMRISYAV